MSVDVDVKGGSESGSKLSKCGWAEKWDSKADDLRQPRQKQQGPPMAVSYLSIAPLRSG